MPKFKNLYLFYILCIVIITLQSSAIGFDSIEFDFSEDPVPAKSRKSLNKSNTSTPVLPPKIKGQLNYDVGPSKSDFFLRDDLGDAIPLKPEEELAGEWNGSYTLDEKSIKWINQDVKHSKIFNSVDFGEYAISLRFEVNELNRVTGLEIAQDNFEYGSVNFQRVDDKKLVYWTRAQSGKWIEVIRGKLVRKSRDEIHTIFQTTVYDKNTPIYSFRGLAKLTQDEFRKSQDSNALDK